MHPHGQFIPLASASRRSPILHWPAGPCQGCSAFLLAHWPGPLPLMGHTASTLSPRYATIQSYLHSSRATQDSTHAKAAIR